MDMGVPPEQEKEFDEYCRHFVNSETKQQENKTEKLENRIQELLDENAKLKKHKDILERTTLNRQATIESLQDKIELLEENLQQADFAIKNLIKPYEEFLCLIANVDFDNNAVKLYFESDEGENIFIKNMMNVMLKMGHELSNRKTDSV